MYIDTTQQKSEALRHILALTGSEDTPMMFQVLGEGGRHVHPKCLYGTVTELFPTLLELNKQGAGIFITVNETDGVGRSKKNIQRIRALFLDDDRKNRPVVFTKEGAAPFTEMAPTLTIQSKNGQHQYFVLAETEKRSLDRFSASQKTLAKHFGTDTSVSDLPRVMRLAGFLHQKDPDKPFLVRVVQTNNCVHRIDDLIRAYGSPAPTDQLRAAQKHADGVEPAVQGQGGDEATFKLAAALTRGFKLNDDEALEVLKTWNARCTPPWSESDLRTKLENARKYGNERQGGRLESAGTPPPTDQLAYLVPSGSFVYRSTNGDWEFSNLLKEQAAVAHLVSLGVSSREAGRIIAGHSYVIAHGADCMPGEKTIVERNGRNILNTYSRPTIVPKPNKFPTIEMIIESITDGDRAGARWLLNWCGFLVQNPGSRNQTAVVLQGSHGSGKTLFARILRNILGEKNTVEIGQRDMENSFNEPIVTKLFVVANEVVSKEHAIETSSQLKSWITDETVIKNAKHQRQESCPNHMTWLFTSNHATPVRLEGETDRRFTVFSSHRLVTPEFRSRIGACFTPSGSDAPSFVAEIEGFAHQLMNMSVDLNIVRTPYANKAREDLARAGRTSVETFCDEIVEHGLLSVIAEYVPTFGRGPQVRAEMRISTADFHQTYVAFCGAEGLKAVCGANLGKEMGQRHPTWKRAKSSTKDRTGRRPNFYVGIPLEGAEASMTSTPAPKSEAPSVSVPDFSVTTDTTTFPGHFGVSAAPSVREVENGENSALRIEHQNEKE